MKKNKSDKQAKFFCESCGSEVNQNAKVCNYCGKFFSSVRCPNCGKTGDTKEFINGCPDCGYAVTGTGSGFNNIKKRKGLFGSSSQGFFNSDSFFGRKQPASSDSLPLWIFVVTIMVLIGLVICLYSCL